MRKDLDKIQWCPWCWWFLTLASIKKVIKDLGIQSKDLLIVSWIWCSWKSSHYINWYWAETLHWRVLPFAIWAKLANPNLTVIWIWWDWDGYWIGLGHFLHACRRDIDITYIVMNNENYWLTTWQASPTTPLWVKTSSTINWNTIVPFQPTSLAKAAWCEMSNQIDAIDIKGFQNLLRDAILYKWFSHIDVRQACPSWKKW